MEATGRLLRAVADRRAPATTRIFQPEPTAAFGRLDRLRSGFDRATRLARENGYTPLLRHGGGHAVLYDTGSVVVETIRPESGWVADRESRFIDMAELLSRGLDRLGVAVAMGELPGEYCPGRFSLHLPAGPKIAGIAQRAVTGALLTTAVLAVQTTPLWRDLTADVYAALDIPLSITTVGGTSDAHPELEANSVADAIALAAASQTGGRPPSWR